jgi:2,5-diamino-6-(ribosylamino)-4(3H)-pyrimidinone 5'-phosphate reductase
MKRPKIILNVCSSIDGKISYAANTTMFDKAPGEFQSSLCSVEEWERFTKEINNKHNPDMFLDGSNMVMHKEDDWTELPKFTGIKKNLYNDYLPEEIVTMPGRKNWTAIIDGKGRYRTGYNAHNDNPETYMLHVTSQSVSPDYLAFLQSLKIPYIIAGEKQVNLYNVMIKLKEKLGINTIITSSGGKLAGALIQQNLLDEIYILFSPIIIGGFKVATLFRTPDFPIEKFHPYFLKLIENKKCMNKLWLHYKVVYNRQ